jgi:PilZ domain
MDAAERRRHPRLHLDGRMVGRATVMTDFRVVALSETGGSLEMEVPLPPGAALDLSLQLSHTPVDLRARVIEVQPPQAGRTAFLVAVEFEGVSDVDAGLLISFLRRERKKDA